MAFAANLLHNRMGQEAELGVLSGLLLQDLRRGETLRGIDEGDAAGKAGEIQGFLRGSVPAACHKDLQIPKKCRVAGGAEGNAPSHVGILIFAAYGPRRSAGGQNHRFGKVSFRPSRQLFYGTVQLRRADGIPDPLNAGSVSLRGHPGDETGAGVPLQLTGVVVQMSSEGDLTAVLPLLQQQGVQTAPAGINGGGQPGRASS